MHKYKNLKGFTLIELLVVFAIISTLASFVLSSLDVAKSRARDAKRKSDMHQMRVAIDLYKEQHGQYPSTGGTYRGVSAGAGSYGVTGSNGYIPSLAPDFIPTLPVDPSGATTGYSGYLYTSNGSYYKLLSHTQGPESFPSPGENYYDPARPGTAWMICFGPTSYCSSI